MSRATILAILSWLILATASASGEDPEVVVARRARDRGDVQTLQKMIGRGQDKAAQRKSFENYLRLARLQNWICEAAETLNNRQVAKAAARAGVEAAEIAVKLNPKSSEAHQLLADLLVQLIPNVFGGGMRYGKRSTEVADKAIELDPKNADAYVTRAISYLYTPEAFGGNKQKGFELLTRATEVAPLADTPRIWLAQYYLEVGKIDAALREINEARRFNPERRFAQYVYDQVTAASKKAAQKQ